MTDKEALEIKVAQMSKHEVDLMNEVLELRWKNEMLTNEVNALKSFLKNRGIDVDKEV